MADIGQKLYKQENIDDNKKILQLLEEARIARMQSGEPSLRQDEITPSLAKARRYANESKYSGEYEAQSLPNLISPESFDKLGEDESWGQENSRMAEDEEIDRLKRIHQMNLMFKTNNLLNK